MAFNSIFKIIDSAFIISAFSAVMYFWGVCNIQGGAGALGIPISLMKRDVWDTIVFGVQGAITTTFLLPFSMIGEHSINWTPVGTIIITIVITLVIWQFTRKSSLRHLFTGVAFIFLMAFHISIASISEKNKNIEEMASCLSNTKCEKFNEIQNTVYFNSSDEKIIEKTGYIMSANDKFLVMLTASGVLVFPIEKLEYFSTAKNQK